MWLGGIAHKASFGSEPHERSFVRVDPDNVVVSCLKLAENSDDYVLRIYDATGMGARAELVFGFDIQEASEVDMLERGPKNLNSQGRKLRVELRPFEINTIRVRAA